MLRATERAAAIERALRGHSVKTSRDLKRAQALLDTAGPFDLLITDILLPDGDGPSFVVSARAKVPELAVVYMTGFAGGAGDQIDLNAPRTVLLQKPFPPMDLMSAIADVVGE